MSSDPFELLGLERASATDAEVRRAYAERLKATRPEDDRAGFMALRAAFERARDEVRWREQYGRDDEDEGEDEDAPEEVAVAADAFAPMPGTDETGEPDERDYVCELSPGEEAFDARICAAMNALVDVLTGSPFGPSAARIREIIDRDDVAGIEEYQAMQWQVRQLLCDRTGFNLDPQALRLPDWLTLAVFDLLDGYYGWTRQPTTNGYERRLNDWLVRVRTEAYNHSPPQEAARQALRNRMNAVEERDQSGGRIWLWIGAGILSFQVVRVLAGLGGG